MTLDASADLAAVLGNLDRVAALRPEDIPALLGTLERVRAALWAQMVRAPVPVARHGDGAGGEPLLTVGEAAAELRFTRAYVYDAVRSGQLAAVRTGKYIRIRRGALTAWLDGGSPTMTIDHDREPTDSVALPARRSAQPGSRRAQGSPPGRKQRTTVRETGPVRTLAATPQRTDG